MGSRPHRKNFYSRNNTILTKQNAGASNGKGTIPKD
jgi:hypothetical protein